jgi:hypothetical protein
MRIAKFVSLIVIALAALTLGCGNPPSDATTTQVSTTTNLEPTYTDSEYTKYMVAHFAEMVEELDGVMSRWKTMTGDPTTEHGQAVLRQCDLVISLAAEPASVVPPTANQQSHALYLKVMAHYEDGTDYFAQAVQLAMEGRFTEADECLALFEDEMEQATADAKDYASAATAGE